MCAPSLVYKGVRRLPDGQLYRTGVDERGREIVITEEDFLRLGLPEVEREAAVAAGHVRPEEAK